MVLANRITHALLLLAVCHLASAQINDQAQIEGGTP